MSGREKRDADKWSFLIDTTKYNFWRLTKLFQFGTKMKCLECSGHVQFGNGCPSTKSSLKLDFFFAEKCYTEHLLMSG